MKFWRIFDVFMGLPPILSEAELEHIARQLLDDNTALEQAQLRLKALRKEAATTRREINRLRAQVVRRARLLGI
jgi:hypothetical protein